MDFVISIPDDLVPGVVASAALENTTPEQVVQGSAIALATKTCQDLNVGPYYVGPTNPLFNADGSPFTPPVVPTPDQPSADAPSAAAVDIDADQEL